MRREGPSSAREKKGRAGGQLLVGLGQGGAAARPLDGSVLTRWGARASARRLATAPWIARSTAFESLSVALALLLCEERRERERRERKERTEWPLGFEDRGRRRLLFGRNERMVVG